MHARGRFLPRAGLWVAAAVVAATVPFVAGPAAADPASTEGRIVFAGGGDIWTMDSDGTDAVRVTGAEGMDSAPTWSPDGSRIAFTSYRGTNSDIYVIDADGSGEIRLTTHAAEDTRPTWSPDGWSIAFTSRRDGNYNIYVMNADGSGETRLTADYHDDDAADWSPDGNWIAWQSNRVGPVDLFKVHPDGTGYTRVTADNDYDRTPAWSPDGQSLVYDRLNTGGRDLHRVNADGTGIARLTTGPQNEERPSFSPDGSQIVFDAALPGTVNRALFLVDSDGSNLVQLTDGTLPSADAEFSPATAGTTTTPPGTATGSTSAGQSLDLAITTPTPGSSTPATTDPLSVTGTAGLSAGSNRPYHAAYVVDVSGSTQTNGHLDCDGSGAFDPVADDFNGDLSDGDILDCEIAAVIALNNAVATVPDATAGVVALGGASTVTNAVLADMSPQAGDQPSTPAALREPSTATRTNVETVLRSLRAGSVGRYTLKSLGTGTDYDAALRRTNEHFAGFASGGTNVAYFLSDGEPNAGTFDTTTEGPLHTAAFRGTRIFTYSVGAGAGGCATGQPLRIVADRTGGTCSAVVSPSALAAAVSEPATLSAVSVTLDDGTPVAATLDTSVSPATWEASLPGGLPAGPHTLRVTATTSDGSSVTATSTVTGLAAPAAEAGGPYTVDEGSTVTLAGTVTDADGGTPAAAWTPADLLTGADTLAPTYAGVDDDEVTVTLTATDGGGLTGTDTATITTVNVAPTLGTTTLAPRPVTGAPFTLEVPFTDPGTMDTHTATIDWGDGTVEDATVDGGVASGGHTFATGGEYTVTVTVTDDDGGAATTQTGPFRVNTAPTVTAGGPYAVDEGSPLTLAGSATDPDGDPLTVAWSPADRVADPASPTSAYDATDDADEVLTLSADDGDLASSAQAQVTVHNVAPTVADLTVPTDVVPPGSPVELTATYTDPGTADTHAATVDWGDGTVDEAPVTGGQVRAQHSYAAGGSWTVTLTVTDDDGGTDSATASVVTNRAPVVDAGSDLAVDEGSATQLDATATDPDGDPLTLTWSPADAVLAATVEDPQLNALDDGSTTLTLTATDPHGATASDTLALTVRNVAPSVTSLLAPATASPMGSAVRVSGAFTDPGSADTHTGRVDWGDGTTGDATLTAGALTAEHTYAAAGIYTVTVQVTDDDGGTGSRAVSDVVVYDRNGRFVTGSGTFTSPAGAVPGDPAANGRASFTTNAMYLPKSDVPAGVTKLDVAGLRFTDLAIDWLVVSGSTATYRGTGALAGRGTYAFTVTAIDGGTGGGDWIRIRIWNPSDGSVVYDDGGSALAGGSIVVHR